MPVARGTTVDPARTRAAIIDAAADVLYQRGLDGVGTAELSALAGVSKETLYRHFGSKDGLIEAVLLARGDRVIRWVHDAASAAGGDPARQLAAVFGALDRWHAEPGFRGDAIVSAAAQHYRDPPRSIAETHLVRLHELLTAIAERAGAVDPAALGWQLVMLAQGAAVVAGHCGAEAGRPAGLAALTLLSASAR